MLYMCRLLIDNSVSNSNVFLNARFICSFIDVDLNSLKSLKHIFVRNLIIDVWLSEISDLIFAHSQLIFDLLKMNKNNNCFFNVNEINFLLEFICLLPD